MKKGYPIFEWEPGQAMYLDDEDGSDDESYGPDKYYDRLGLD